MNQIMFDINEVTKMIEDGETLLLSGDEMILKKLPQGHWIGGTIPYFMAESGGLFTQDKICVTRLSNDIVKTEIKVYDEKSIHSVYTDIPENAFCLIIIPAFSQTHMTYALESPSFDMFAAKPLIGWISGCYLENLGKDIPKIFNGEDSIIRENGAIVMNITLPEHMIPEIDILNIFEQGDGDTITFMDDGFSATDALINGKKVIFSEYLTFNNIDIRLPLVADYSGAMINTSFQEVNVNSEIVTFYAPVFKGVEYKHAKPIEDYVSKFTANIPTDGINNMFFSCNCILNYIYSELEGKQTGEITGPITFGEIAYKLLNQTLAYIRIHNISDK